MCGGLRVNDFTKEELQYLRDRIYERPNSVTENMKKMRDKIQSMIDDYCEHEECQHESDGNVQALLVNPPIYTFTCKKCGVGYR